jgi:hypothetical protein
MERKAGEFFQAYGFVAPSLFAREGPGEEDEEAAASAAADTADRRRRQRRRRRPAHLATALIEAC